MKKSILIKATLYQQIANNLREVIRTLPHGARLESESELVARFGVSVPTVREALKLLGAEGLLSRKQGRGTYVVKKGAHAGKHVAVVIDQDISDAHSSPIYLQVAQDACRQLETQDIPVRLYIGTNRPSESRSSIKCPAFIEALEERKLCGVVAVLAYPESSWVAQLEEQRIPIVRNGADKEFGVNLNYRAFVIDAVAEMIAMGRKDLALLSWRGDSAFYHGAQESFVEALIAHGLKVRPEWGRGNLHPSLLGAGWEEFREIWLASEEKPDGIIVLDDLLFQSMVPAVLEMGIRVPDQLAIATLINAKTFTPVPFHVTGFKANSEKIAEALVGMLLELMRGETPVPMEIMLPFEKSLLTAPRSQEYRQQKAMLHT